VPWLYAPSGRLLTTHGFRRREHQPRACASSVSDKRVLVHAASGGVGSLAEYALSDIRRAHELSESERARGKIALHVGQP
jgi:hypothetical protein